MFDSRVLGIFGHEERVCKWRVEVTVMSIICTVHQVWEGDLIKEDEMGGAFDNTQEAASCAATREFPNILWNLKGQNLRQ
jgi:hypothetical protein